MVEYIVHKYTVYKCIVYIVRLLGHSLLETCGQT